MIDARARSRLRPWPQARLPSVPEAGRSRLEAWGEGVLSSERAVCNWDLPPPRAPELLPKHVAVRFGCARRDTEPLTDFLVGAAGCDQLDDLALAIGDRRLRLAKC